MKSKIQFSFLVLCVVLVYTASLQARSFELEDSGWAMVARSELITGGELDVPFVYSVTADAVTIQIDKLFNRPFDQDGLNYPIIVEFEKLSADATPKIIINDEWVKNKTGSQWYDYHMHLVVDSQNPEAGFDPDSIPDGDQLEDVSFSGDFGYNGLPTELRFMDTNGKGVLSYPPGESGENWFQPGWENGAIVIVTNPGLQVGKSFGLKEIPTIPEPATLVLLGIGGLMTLTGRGKGNHCK
jgi:hypothetical protein